MKHQWLPPEHTHTIGDPNRKCTLIHCAICKHGVALEGWRADMPEHWKDLLEPCPLEHPTEPTHNHN